MSRSTPGAIATGLAVIIGALLGVVAWPDGPRIAVIVLVVVLFAGGFAVAALLENREPAPPPAGPEREQSPPAPEAPALPTGQPQQRPDNWWPEQPQAPQRIESPPTDAATERPTHWWVSSPPSRATQPKARSTVRFDPRHARIAQCPKCGGFDLNVGRDDHGYRFACRSCPSAWQWAPGAPWPGAAPDPRRRQRPDRVGPDRVGPDVSDQHHPR